MRYRVATNRPLNKVSAAATAGALVAIVAWGLKQFMSVELPSEVQAALIILVSAAAAYQTPLADDEVVCE